MAYLHDERDQQFGEPEDQDRTTRPQRELTLSTGTILGIFFGLALLCGAFFAFGFNMGSKTKTVSAASATTGEAAAGKEANFSSFKPSSGTPALQPVPGYLTPKEAQTANNTAASVSAYPAGSALESGAVKPPPALRPVSVSAPSAASADSPQPRPAQAPHASPAASEPVAGPAPVGAFLVQVAAVSHQEDADLLVGALRRKGYTVAARSEPQDRLFHIQVGPFGNKKDAEAMRQRLLGDGYNAIVK